MPADFASCHLESSRWLPAHLEVDELFRQVPLHLQDHAQALQRMNTAPQAMRSSRRRRWCSMDAAQAEIAPAGQDLVRWQEVRAARRGTLVCGSMALHLRVSPEPPPWTLTWPRSTPFSCRMCGRAELAPAPSSLSGTTGPMICVTPSPAAGKAKALPHPLLGDIRAACMLSASAARPVLSRDSQSSMQLEAAGAACRAHPGTSSGPCRRWCRRRAPGPP